jgi:hypothetical protein
VKRLFIVEAKLEKTCRFIVSSAVALLNYISSGLLWRIFSQNGIFAGFSLHIINFAVRGRRHYIFKGVSQLI